MASGHRGDTSLTKTTTNPASSWISKVLPATATLASHGLRFQDETPASAQRLTDVVAEDFLETSPDVERTLMEAFLEDDYDGRLHLITLSTSKETAGIVFWREVPREEMTEWMDMQRIAKAVADRRLTCSNSIDDDLKDKAKQSLKMAQNDSIVWIREAIQSHSTMSTLAHAWVKIELIAIKRTHRAMHLGNILLGYTLAKAAMHQNEHAILHVAGGGASKNIPAARLYGRYGFMPVPPHRQGGPFVKPDKDLFVLGNISSTLNALPWAWEDMMQTGSSSALPMENRDSDMKQQRVLRE